MIRLFTVIFIAVITAVTSESNCGAEYLMKCRNRDVSIPFASLNKLPDEEFLQQNWVKGDEICHEIESVCSTEPSFEELAARAREETGDTFLSNEFFQENCNLMVEYWECAQNYTNTCRADLIFDVDILVNYTTEFCNEDSDLRKAYVANLVCVNGMNLTSQACFISTQQKMVQLVPDIIEILKTSSLRTFCLFSYAVRPCVLGLTKDTCGEDAEAAVVEFMNRLMDIYMCDPDDTAIFEDLLSRLH